MLPKDIKDGYIIPRIKFDERTNEAINNRSFEEIREAIINSLMHTHTPTQAANILIASAQMMLSKDNMLNADNIIANIPDKEE